MELKTPVKVKTYFGFPVSSHQEVEKKRGIALMITVMMIAMMIIFTSDLIVTSQVNLELGVSHRDNVKSEYLAKSGANLALFFVSIDWGIKLFQCSNMNTKFKDIEGVSPNVPDENFSIWSISNELPPIGGEDSVKMIEAFNLSKVMDVKLIESLKQFDGDFTAQVSDESALINVNYFSAGRGKEVAGMLNAMFSCPAEKQFLENKKIRPRELIYKIKDYIDLDNSSSPESGVSDESDPYMRMSPPRRAKSKPLISVDELRMIDGWDDDMHTVFSPYMTVYPMKEKDSDLYSLNINTISNNLRACLFSDGMASDRDKFVRTLDEKSPNKGAFSQKNNASESIKDLGIVPGGIPGVEDTDERMQWFKDTSEAFRITAKGRAGLQEKVLTMVIRREVPDGKTQKNSYKVLHYSLK